MESQRKISTIAFAVVSPKGTDLWPAPTDGLSYGAGNALGRERADALVQYMSDNQAPQMLGNVIAAMVEKGVYDAVEIGFCSQIAIYAVQGALTGTPLTSGHQPEATPAVERPKLQLIFRND